MSNALTLITSEINAAREDFMTLLSDRSIKFEQEAGFAIQVLSNNDYSLKIAMNNRASIVNAVKNIAAIGISLNPAKKQAYLVPRGGAICLDISYMGLMDLAMATGSIKWAQAELVRANDGFARGRFDQPPTHTFNPFSKERGEIVGVYVVVKTADGDYLTHTMEIGDVYDIRDRSEAWKRNGGGPWKTDPGEMIKKTCVKQAYKYWPKTERLETAIHHLNTDGGEGLVDISARTESLVDVNPVIAAALRTTTDADALKFWRENNAAFAKQPADHAKLKDAIAGHRARMKAGQEAADAERTLEMEPPTLTPEELDAQREIPA
jgi:recombination protein RecT